MTNVIEINNVESSVEKIQIVNLLYEKDSKFVPITPLAALDDGSVTTFYKATIGPAGHIRAASSFEEWLSGCDRKTMASPCTVYELASSIVRNPMGGFEKPSLQQIFAFVRLVAIMDPFIFAEDRRGAKISVIASIAAGNRQSLTGMSQLGMIPVRPRPKWLHYEHRAWFPKLRNKKRSPNEARYLWLPGDRVKTFMKAVAPYASGKKELQRESRTSAGVIEKYKVDIAIAEYANLIGHFGTLEAAIEVIPYDIFGPPPDLAQLRADYPGQPSSDIVF
jgi:hypothetical protein